MLPAHICSFVFNIKCYHTQKNIMFENGYCLFVSAKHISSPSWCSTLVVRVPYITRSHIAVAYDQKMSMYTCENLSADILRHPFHAIPPSRWHRTSPVSYVTHCHTCTLHQLSKHTKWANISATLLPLTVSLVDNPWFNSNS